MKFKKNINEATGTSQSSGRYTIPISPGFRLFDKKTLEPFTIEVSKYDDAGLAFDSYDGKLDVSKKTAQKIEKKAKAISNFIKKHPTGSDDDGDILNQSPKVTNESLRNKIKRILKEESFRKK